MEQAQEDVSQNCRAVGATAAAAAMATPLFVLLINYSYVHVCRVCGDVYVRVTDIPRHAIMSLSKPVLSSSSRAVGYTMAATAATAMAVPGATLSIRVWNSQIGNTWT